MTRLAGHRTVDAPPSIVWEVITDPAVYAEAAPNLDSVEIIEGDGVGMVRRCVDTDGNAWTETCTRWEDGRGFDVTVDVDTSEFHRRFFNHFSGKWELAETDTGVEMTIAFDFDPKYGPLGILISKYLSYNADGLIEAIFDHWEREIINRAQGDARQSEYGRQNAVFR